MDTKQKSKYKKLLLNLKEELLIEISQKKVVKENNIEGDDADIAAEYLSLQMTQLFTKREKQQLDQIELALEKIERDEYGICEECGDEINEKRMQTLPFVNLCVECKGKSEEEGSSTIHSPLDSNQENEDEDEDEDDSLLDSD